MNERERCLRPALAVGLLLVAWLTAGLEANLEASDLDEFKVKREAVFEFAQKPVVTRAGDRVTIEFETKGFCDVTVAIENAEKGVGDPIVKVPDPFFRHKIVRHLASGVLGPNAPAPLQKNSKKQTLIWDGKDDQGAYIDEKDKLTVRVSLGFKARLERVLFWEPKKRVAPEAAIVRAAPEGVYVYEGRAVDHLRLFDHDGNYLRTVYPFPADKLPQMADLDWREFPDAPRRMPLKRGSRESTLLTSGSNGRPSASDFSDEYKSSESHAATGVAVGGPRIALVMHTLNRLATDGSTGGLPLNGPRVEVLMARRPGARDRADTQDHYVPTDAAFSPDGQWLYLAGFGEYFSNLHEPWQRSCAYLHGVARMRFDGHEPPAVFKGRLTRDGAGSGDDQFNSPTSVAVDAKGRVYVADYLNDRVQVFTPDGGLVKSVPVEKPVVVRVHQKTGDVYVFTWALPVQALLRTGVKIKAVLRVFGPVEEAALKAEYPLPAPGYEGFYSGFYMGTRRDCWAELDSWTDPPTIWLSVGMRQSDWGRGEFGEGQKSPAPSWAASGLRLLVPKGNALEVRRDFAADTVRSVKRAKPPRQYAQHLFANPVTGRLYVLEFLGRGSGLDGTDELIEIDPKTGAIVLLKTPFVFEDLAFGPDGLAYFQSTSTLFRYDLATGQQVPFDYGVEAKVEPGYDVVAGLPLAGFDSWHHWSGKIAVSPIGHVAAAVRGAGAPSDRRGTDALPPAEKAWRPTLFPGRAVGEYLHVWDRYGKRLYEDALPGMVGWMTGGMAIDRNDDLYVVLNSRVAGDGARFAPKTGVLMKVTPEKARLLSPAKAPVPLPAGDRPDRPVDLAAGWVEGARWRFGPVGFSPTGLHCGCWHSNLAVDAFSRSFAPQPHLAGVAVLDTNGNLILRIGQYGNADDGVPLSDQPDTRHLTPGTRSIGGDEVGLFAPNYVATDTDRRLFIADAGNARILSVKLDYHASERIALKDVKEGG